MYADFLKISKKTGVPLKKILDVFWYLLKDKEIENNQLLQMVGVSRNALNQVKKALSLYLQPSSQYTILKIKASKEIKKIYPLNYQTEEEMWSFLIKKDIYEKSFEFFRQIKNKIPPPQRNYDQFRATPETVAKRVALMDFFEDIREKKMLFLGDSDFTSVATANLHLAGEIMVVDIDKRVVKAIKKVGNEFNLRINAMEYDLRNPPYLKEKFDVVFTDPPYTLVGMELFISRAVEFLDKKNQAARIYFCYGNSDRAKERFLPIQKIINKVGLILRWVFDKFNRYEGAESIGNASSLYIADVTPQTRFLIKGEGPRKIYTYHQ